MSAKRWRSSEEQAAAVRRFAGGYNANSEPTGMVKRAAEGDVTALHALREMAAAVEQATIDAARALNEDPRYGLSWGDIGRELGVTRQAARQRFGRRDSA